MPTCRSVMAKKAVVPTRVSLVLQQRIRGTEFASTIHEHDTMSQWHVYVSSPQPVASRLYCLHKPYFYNIYHCLQLETSNMDADDGE